MNKRIVLIELLSLISISAYSSFRTIPYFASEGYENVVLGYVIDMDTVMNYTIPSMSDYKKGNNNVPITTGYICSIQVRIVDKFNKDISDTLWIHPDTTNIDFVYYNICNYVSVQERDIPKNLYYFKAWSKDDKYYYSLIDYNFALPLVNDSVYGVFTKKYNRWNKMRITLNKVHIVSREKSRLQKWSREKFERVLKRKIKTRLHQR